MMPPFPGYVRAMTEIAMARGETYGEDQGWGARPEFYRRFLENTNLQIHKNFNRTK